MVIQRAREPWLQKLFLVGLQEQQDSLFRRVALRWARISLGAKDTGAVQMGSPQNCIGRKNNLGSLMVWKTSGQAQFCPVELPAWFEQWKLEPVSSGPSVTT